MYLVPADTGLALGLRSAVIAMFAMAGVGLYLSVAKYLFELVLCR